MLPADLVLIFVFVGFGALTLCLFASLGMILMQQAFRKRSGSTLKKAAKKPKFSSPRQRRSSNIPPLPAVSPEAIITRRSSSIPPLPAESPVSKEESNIILLWNNIYSKQGACGTLNPLLLDSKDFEYIMNNKSKFFIVDCRSKREYDAGHLTGAINIAFPKDIGRLIRRKDNAKLLLFEGTSAIPSGQTNKVFATELKGLLGRIEKNPESFTLVSGDRIVMFHCQFSNTRSVQTRHFYMQALQLMGLPQNSVLLSGGFKNLWTLGNHSNREFYVSEYEEEPEFIEEVQALKDLANEMAYQCKNSGKKLAQTVYCKEELEKDDIITINFACKEYPLAEKCWTEINKKPRHPKTHYSFSKAVIEYAKAANLEPLKCGTGEENKQYDIYQRSSKERTLEYLSKKE